MRPGKKSPETERRAPRRTQPMKCITVLYPSKDNEDFNFEFYKNRHAKLIEDILGPALARTEIRRGLPGPDGQLPPHIATISFWIRDWDSYEKAMAARAPELIAEVPLFSKQQPSFQIDELVYEYEG
jgi:uncharacterized protein (TIGR02118 family)